jgi:hypothetical protein
MTRTILYRCPECGAHSTITIFRRNGHWTRQIRHSVYGFNSVTHNNIIIKVDVVFVGYII